MRLSPKERSGLLFALLGVFLFSLSLPMTKWALESFDPFLTATARPIIACCVAIPVFAYLKIPRVPREYVRPMIFTAIGAVFGWPIFIALALQRTTATHVAVIASIMPLVTAIMAVIKTRKHVPLQFWLASLCGTAMLVLFAVTRGGDLHTNLNADVLTLIAVLASSYCYVEGAELTKIMPGWQVISWVVIYTLPVCIVSSVIIWLRTHSDHPVTFHGVFGLIMIGISSMYLGFFAWYRGLRDVGTARGSQVQQLQALFTLGWAVLLLKEKVSALTLLTAVGVVLCVLWALSARIKNQSALGSD